MIENENTSSDSFNSPLNNYISLLKKSLNKIHRPILNKIHKPILKSFKPSLKRKPINILNFDFLKDPNHFYWEEQSSIYKMNPFDLFNLILKSKFNLSDKNFTEENDFLLIKSVEEGKKWLEIGIKIGKHPLLCIKRFIKLNKNKNNWTQLEDKILLKTVEKEKDWLKISLALENKTLKQCKDRYKKIVKIYKKGKWTKEEDEILKDVCDKFEDKNWVFISTFIPKRSDVQCRERWMNTLKPGLKLGKWSEDEDKKLIEIVKEKGKKWSIVSEIMESRTDSQCRKRYMILKKKDGD